MARWEVKTVDSDSYRKNGVPKGWEPFGYTWERIAIRRRRRWWHSPKEYVRSW